MFKKAELDRQKHILTRLTNYWKDKAREAKESAAASSKASASLAMDREQEHDQALGQLRKQMLLFENTVAELEEQLQQAQQPTQLHTMRYGRYTDDVCQCCLALVANNVSVHHVAGAIRNVLRLVDISAEPLPSVSLLKQMIVEGRVASLVQVGEAACHDNNTHYDGTTKFGRKYGSFQLSTEDQQLTISVNDVYCGAAEDSLELLKTCTDQISEACRKAGSTVATGEKLIASIKNTMSDRAATNTKFNRLLHDYRQEILPVVHSSWANLGDEERAALSRVNNHFCGLHMVVNLAEQLFLPSGRRLLLGHQSMMQPHYLVRFPDPMKAALFALFALRAKRSRNMAVNSLGAQKSLRHSVQARPRKCCWQHFAETASTSFSTIPQACTSCLL